VRPSRDGHAPRDRDALRTKSPKSTSDSVARTTPDLKRLTVCRTGVASVPLLAAVGGSTARHVIAVLLYGPSVAGTVCVFSASAARSVTVMSPALMSVKPHSTAFSGARWSTM
jgi:hypothetical protein